MGSVYGGETMHYQTKEETYDDEEYDDFGDEE